MPAMDLRECFTFISGRRTDELVITAAGNVSVMWWDLTHDLNTTYYVDASMSLASMFTAGLAIGPRRPGGKRRSAILRTRAGRSSHF